MSWAEVKKINSDLKTPLNETLGDKKDVASVAASASMFAFIKSMCNDVKSIFTNVNTINSNTARGAVKSVQRGGLSIGSGTQASGKIVTIYPVVLEKSYARLINNSDTTDGYTLTSTALTIINKGTLSNSKVYNWEVIEFY